MALPGPPPYDDPARNFALVVAIERYRARRPDLSLDGPSHDAIAWSDWFIRVGGVPRENLQILAYPTASNEEYLVNSGISSCPNAGPSNSALKDALERFQGRDGRLWIVWSGHGLMTPQGERFALLAGYHEKNREVLKVDALKDHLRQELLQYPKDQVLVFDTCASPYDVFVHRQSLSYDSLGSGPPQPGCRQFLMFASEDGTVAWNQEGRGGVFTRELLASLMSLKRNEPADLFEVHGRMLRRFENLHQQRDGKVQRPILYTWQGPGGHGQENIDLIPNRGLADEFAGKGGYLESLSAHLAQFPWPRPRVGVTFFSSLHIQVQVAPSRRHTNIDKQDDRQEAGIRAESEEAERRAYQSRADAKSFSQEEGKSPIPWAATQRGKGARHKYPWAVILADPGLGKTTLLRYEGWKTAQEEMEKVRSGEADVREALIPIFVRQADLAGELESEEIEDIILKFALEPSRVGRANFSPAFRDFLGGQIKIGKFVILLDAQDEVVAKNYKRLRKRVQHILALLPARVYFSSRHAGYRGNLLERGDQIVPELEIVAFASEDIQRFIRAYFGSERSSGGRKLSDGVWEALRRKSALLGLAQTPLLITMLCVAVWERRQANRPELPLPSRRGALYAECLHGLLGGWSMYRDGGLASPRVRGEVVEEQVVPRRRLLATLAWELAGYKLENTLFSRIEVLARLKANTELMTEARFKDARKALDVLCRRNGVIVSEGDSYLFLHLSFQEYLIAWNLAQLINEMGWEKAVVTIDHHGTTLRISLLQLLDRMSWLPRWQEVVPLLAGELDNPVPLLEILADERKDDLYRHRLALAARSLSEIRFLLDAPDLATH